MSANLTVPPEFERASKEQRIAFVQDLWDRIAQDEKSVPLPSEHQRILRERLREYREGSKPGEPWSVVRDELLAKLSRPLRGTKSSAPVSASSLF